ncbi:uncharacterized protein ARMOST_18184 [Armillaria ostoyae]|uniref:Uncharacterized protein n=1 Tax=Armillaria ostoyae TaxID=47428 RepID=A0A284S161_ARMOS|nr:uncharacterized protein ARMOST_18184 [Armillaria ostoyae]
MSSFPAGSRVFFYNSNGRLTGGIVESTSAMQNGSRCISRLAVRKKKLESSHGNMRA